MFEKVDSLDKTFFDKEFVVSELNKYEVSPKRFIDVICDKLNLE